ncbi:MAG: thiamine phosphate synthase [Bryobacterales bacterium]|nr:thiamine phosphate synthase [Bryobacterales bacterium]
MIPKLYAIADTATLERHGLALVATARAFLDGGARLVQVRHKGQFSRLLYADCVRVAAMCAEAGARLVIDDRADIAMLLDCGLHVGQTDLPPVEARRLIGTDRLLGYSTHNAAQLAEGDGMPVDYLAIGPVFATGSKENPDPVVGVETLKLLRGSTKKPLVAIGGITLENAPRVLEAGADSLAIIRDLIPEGGAYGEIRARVEEWRRNLGDMV